MFEISEYFDDQVASIALKMATLQVAQDTAYLCTYQQDAIL